MSEASGSASTWMPAWASWPASWSGSGAKARTPSSGYASSTRELRWRSPGRPRASTFRSLAAKAAKVFEEAGALADRLIASLRNAPPWPGAASDGDALDGDGEEKTG
jgi:hypothetical protein